MNYQKEVMRLMPGALLTPPDFFQLRFPSKLIRGISSAMLIFGLAFYAVGQLIGMSLAMSNIGLNYQMALVICTAIIIWTTIRAGTPGIIVNDTINMVTFVVACVLLLPFAFKAVGGLDNLIAVSSEARPGIWGATGYKNAIFTIISYNLIWNFMTSGSPHLVQRAYVAKDEKIFLKSQVIGVFLVIVWTWFLYSSTQSGLLLFPDLAGKASDNLLPLVAIKVMPSLLAGLVLASIFAVGFSTINTQISNLAFSASRDIYQKLINPKVSEKDFLSFTKLMIVVLSLFVAFFAWVRPGFIYEITSWGIAFYGACFVPMFVFGFFWKRATATGVLIGISVSSLTFILLGLLKLTNTFTLPYGIHPFLVTLPLTIIIIVVASLMTQQSEREKEVATAIRDIVARKTDKPAQPKDYIVPIVILVLSLTMMIVLLKMFS